MISPELNETLTRVGPGTPGGELMRRYWHPIAATTQLERNATKRVRLLGEDLVLFKDRSGTLGLIDPLCAHRRVDQPQRSRPVFEQHQVLAQQPHPLGSISLQLSGCRNGVPVAPHKLAARRPRPNSRQRFV